MTSADPTQDLPPYEPERVLAAPFAERVRLACVTWAAQLNPNLLSVMTLYWTKYLFVFIGGWAFFVSLSAGYPGFASPLSWAFMGVAFQKAVVWSMFYELMGFGCGWGPMNARFNPWFGGARHFARPGTTKLPLFPGIPIFGGYQRSWLDVGLYVANQLFLLRVLISPEVTPELLLPSLILVPVLGLTDKTLFLAARAEHYYVALVILAAAAGDALWISGCKILWGCIWFWAATSKLNHHFPTVIMFMMNNGPFFPTFLKKRLMRSYPDDLRPSALAAVIANFGTLAEYTIPLVLLTSNFELATVLALVLMTGFHGFIALNNPNGMPVEWNILMVYGGIFLFGFNFGVQPLDVVYAMPLLGVFLFLALVVMQTYGNFVPSKVSFLMAMRYYAGNWAYNVWLFRKGGSVDKLKKLKKVSGTTREQLSEIMPDQQSVEVASVMMMTSRFLHLQGRPLQDALPLAVDNIENYDWYEGELLGGMILGWNFGDGHLNGMQLARAIQDQCGFEEGELRIVSVESSPLFGDGWDWEINDAASGLIEKGHTSLGPSRAWTPYPTGEAAARLARGNGGA